MKKILLLLLACGAFSCFAADINLIPDADGAQKFKKWYNPPHAKITAANGIITITANTSAKVNPYQKAQALIPVKGAAIQNKKFELSFKYRTEKLDGALQVAIRMVSGKSGTYHGVTLKRWDVSKEWKEYKHVFSTRANTTELCLYIVGFYMKEGEKVELKDIKLIAK
jgi:hypothetical protein